MSEPTSAGLKYWRDRVAALPPGELTATDAYTWLQCELRDLAERRRRNPLSRPWARIVRERVVRLAATHFRVQRALADAVITGTDREVARRERARLDIATAWTVAERMERERGRLMSSVKRLRSPWRGNAAHPELAARLNAETAGYLAALARHVAATCRQRDGG